MFDKAPEPRFCPKRVTDVLPDRGALKEIAVEIKGISNVNPNETDPDSNPAEIESEHVTQPDETLAIIDDDEIHNERWADVPETCTTEETETTPACLPKTTTIELPDTAEFAGEDSNGEGDENDMQRDIEPTRLKREINIEIP